MSSSHSCLQMYRPCPVAHRCSRLLALSLLLMLLPSLLHAQRVHAVVEDCLDEVNCQSAQRLVWHEDYTVRLLDDNASALASFAFGCDDTRKLNKFTMTISDASGRIIRKVKKGDLKATEYSPDMVTNGVSYYFSYEPASYPVTVTVSTEVEMTGAIASFPTFQPMTAYQTEVRHARYRLWTPAGMKPRYATQHLDAPVTTTPQPDGRTLTEVEVSILPAIQREPLSQPVRELLPMAWFAPEEFTFYKTRGSNRTWQEFGLWQHSLLEGRDLLPADFQDKLREMTRSCATDRQKVDRIYQFLRQTTRYISIQLGIGGWQPAAAATVWQKGMGDCKALANYTKAMLTAVGIPSVYTIIHTDRRHLHPDFVSMNQFNHVILQVPLPQDTLWLECTNPALPLGFLHDGIAGHDCLLITGDGGRVSRVPAYPEEQNRTVNKADIRLRSDGSADVSLSVSYEAADYTDGFRLPYLDKKKQGEWLARHASLPQARYDNLVWNDTIGDCRQPVFRITADAAGTAYAKKTGTRLFLPLNPFHSGYAAYSQQEQRANDLYVGQGYTVVDSINISLPDGFRVESLPFAPSPQGKSWRETVEMPCGTFTTEVTDHGQQLTAVFTRTVRQGSYDSSLYQQLLQNMTAIARLYQSRAVIIGQ